MECSVDYSIFKTQYVSLRDKFGVGNKAFADKIIYKGKSMKISDMDEKVFEEIHLNLDSFDVSGNRSTQMQSGLMSSGVGRNAVLQTSTGTNMIERNSLKMKSSRALSN